MKFLVTIFYILSSIFRLQHAKVSSSILVITGFGGLGVNLSPEVINLEGKTCSRLPEKYPKNVAGATGGIINGQVIICGGYDRDATERLNECYLLKKGGSWTLLGNLSETRSYSSSVVIDNSLYLISGRGNACESIESITLDGQIKKHEPGYPHCILDHSTIAINRTTSITIGGYDEFHKTYYYNGKEFSKGPDLITGRFAHAAGLLRDKVTNDEYIAVVGGWDSNYDYLDSLELLKIGDNKWKSGNPLPKKIYGHAIVSISGDIIVIGGWDDDNELQSILYKLSCQNEDCQWTTLPQSLKFARNSMVAIAIPDDFFYCN